MLGLAQCPLVKARTEPGPFPACRRGRGSLVLDTQGDAGVDSGSGGRGADSCGGGTGRGTCAHWGLILVSFLMVSQLCVESTAQEMFSPKATKQVYIEWNLVSSPPCPVGPLVLSQLCDIAAPWSGSTGRLQSSTHTQYFLRFFVLWGTCSFSCSVAGEMGRASPRIPEALRPGSRCCAQAPAAVGEPQDRMASAGWVCSSRVASVDACVMNLLYELTTKSVVISRLP